jgi:thiamine transporter ThiT
MLAEVLHFKFLRLCERRNFLMDNAQSEKEESKVEAEKGQKDWISKSEEWIKAHLWLLSMIASALILLCLCGPFVHTRPVSYDATADAFTRLSKVRNDIWVGGLFSPAFGWPFAVIFVLIVGGIVLAYFGKKNKNLSFVAMLLDVVAGILFLLSVNFYDFSAAAGYVGYHVDVLDDYYPTYADLASTKLAFGAIYGAVMCFISAFFCFDYAYSKEDFSVRDMSEIGILTAMAVGLHFVKFEIGTSGGSINFAAIPLFVIALRHGPVKGLFASGIIYGLIQCTISGYGFVVYPLDYLVGFGCYGILGLFKKYVFTADAKGWSVAGFFWIALGIILATFVRFAASTASSMINYGYSFQAALLYNSVYIPVSGAIGLAAILALYPALARLEKHYPTK